MILQCNIYSALQNYDLMPIALVMDSEISQKANRSGVQSVEIGMRVAELFTATDGPLALRDIAKGAGLGASAAHRYVVSLVRAGLLIQLSDQRYDLGPFARRLGFAALGRIDGLAVAETHLAQFVATTGVTAMLSVWSERGPLVVRWIRGMQPVFTTIAVGSALPLENSATGRAFLGYYDDPGMQVLSKNKAAATAIGAQVRKAGFAEVSGDLVPGLFAVAVPVLDGTGGLVAVITAVNAAAELSAANRRALLQTGRDASSALGFSH